MAGTAWFSSTMAQASAAIAGLIIAFSAVHYQLERQQLEKRTEKLRDELISLRRKYYNVIKLMAAALSPNPSQIETWSQETEQCISDPLGINADGLEDTIQEADGIENPTTMCMYAHLSRIVELFKEIEESPKPELDYLLSSHQFAEMRKSTRLLAELFEPPYEAVFRRSNFAR